jgi:hypothetical protein
MSEVELTLMRQGGVREAFKRKVKRELCGEKARIVGPESALTPRFGFTHLCPRDLPLFRPMRKLLLLSLFAQFAVNFACAADKPEFALDDSFNYVDIPAVAISPDGNSVVIDNERRDGDESIFRRDLRLYGDDGHGGGRLTQFTHSGDNTKPQRSDRRWIAFLSERKSSKGGKRSEGDFREEAVAQLYLIPLAGGAAFPLIRGDEEVHSFCWSSAHIAAAQHSQRIAFTRAEIEEPTEVCLANSIAGLQSAGSITSFNQLSTERDLPRAKPYRWTADDRTAVEGMLMYPPQEFEAKPLPMFVFPHLSGQRQATSSTSAAKEKIFAQALVENTLAKHPELAGLGLSTTPPDGRGCVTIADTDPKELGEKCDRGELNVMKTGKSTVEKEGDGYDVTLPLHVSGKTIGIIGMDFKLDQQPAGLLDRAKVIAADIENQLHSKAKLFEPAK